MIEKIKLRLRNQDDESGQTLVLFAFLIIVLLAFVGLAVDVSFIWMRGSQLTRAVDAATLAGATELGSGVGSNLLDANAAAKSFLYANDIPPDVIELAENNAANSSSRSSNILGAQTYTLTVTWPVELYFLRVIGMDEVDLTRRATAAYFPLVDIYSSRRVESGVVNSSTQSIFGPHICTSYGDAFTPFDRNNAGAPNPWRSINNGVYQFRIAIPNDFETNTGQSLLRVELFDPDTYNRPPESGYLLVHSDLYSDSNGVATDTSTACGGGRHNACLIQTCEWDEQSCGGGVTQYELDDINPFWFVRIDENRGAGDPANHGTGACSGPQGNWPLTDTDVYHNGYNSPTRFELFYFRQEADGTLVRVILASYTSQTFDTTQDFDVSGGLVLGHGTDLQWVSPGAINSLVPPLSAGSWGNAMDGAVPTDCGSALGGYSRPGDDARPVADRRCGAAPYSPPSEGGGFEIDLDDDVTGILRDSNTGLRYIYLNVQALDGASENNFEIWAGPPYDGSAHSDPELQVLPADVNARNLFSVNNPGLLNSAGVGVFALGILPINSLFSNVVEIPLLYIGPEYSGSVIEISLFDPDSGTVPPVTFYFDTVARNDYEVAYNAFDCGGNCDNAWVGDPVLAGTDPFMITVPELNDQCDDTGLPEDCTPFYGGNLYIEYQAGAQDTYRWLITLPSLPFLTE